MVQSGSIFMIFPLAAPLLDPTSGDFSPRKNWIEKGQPPPQFDLRPAIRQLLQRSLVREGEEQKAKSSGRLHAAHTGGFLHVCLSGACLFWILCCKQLGQFSLSKCRAADLLNRHLDRILSLQDRCDVWAWLPDRVELEIQECSQIIWKWLTECEQVEGSAPCATAPALPLPCRSRHKTTPSEPQENHNALSNSKVFSKSPHSQSSLYAAPETLWSAPYHQSVMGQECQSAFLKNHAFLPRITVVFLGRSHGRIALFLGKKSAAFFRFASKISPCVRRTSSLTHFRSQNFSKPI